MKVFRAVSVVLGVTIALIVARMSKAESIQSPKTRANERQFLVQFVVSGPKGNKTPPLSHPYIMVAERQQAKLLVGGTQVALPGTGTVETLETGLSVQVNIAALEGDKVQLDLSLAMNDLKTGDKKKVTLVGRSVRDIEIVKLGEPVHLALDDDGRSVEITITPASAGH